MKKPLCFELEPAALSWWQISSYNELNPVFSAAIRNRAVGQQVVSAAGPLLCYSTEMHTLDLRGVPSELLTPQPPHIGLSWHGSLEPCLLIPEAIHPFTHFETIKWSQWLLGPDSIGTWREGKPAEIGLNDENYCAQKESIGAFQRNSILFTKGFGRQSENGNATLLGEGGEEMKREMEGCFAWQAPRLLRTVHLLVMLLCVSQAAVEFVLSATKLAESGLSFTDAQLQRRGWDEEKKKRLFSYIHHKAASWKL